MAKWGVIALLALLTLVGLARVPVEAQSGHYSFHYSFGNQTPGSQQTMPRQPSGAPDNYGAHHPVWMALMTALFGGWLGFFLFPQWGAGFGFGNVVGSILSLLVLLWIVRLALRAFAGGSRPALAGAASALRSSPGAGAGASPTPQSKPLAISGTDYAEFEVVLKGVQRAWTEGDVAALGKLMTPEMASVFQARLAQNQASGVKNRLESVELLRGDLRDARDEGTTQYATCYLRWRATDCTVRLDRQPSDPDYVVRGDLHQPREEAELWTFVRSPGGHWLLSAIHQA